jgi:phosphoribosyl 1,2-cyclic phosphodiesterase
MKVKCWGTRGSIPVPNEKTVRFGGNTPCVEITADSGKRLVCDAGTGIINLGKSLMTGEFSRGQGNLHILLSHTHWDHIQGLPFLIPTFVKGNKFFMWGPKYGQASLYDIVANQFDPVYSPLCDLKNLGAKFHINEIEEQAFEVNGFLVKTIKLRHLSPCLGFRVEEGGKSVVYLSDLSHKKLDSPDREIIAFARNADLLLHDSYFTQRELANMQGWGHSSFEQAAEVAARAKVKKLVFFHYNPDHSDTDLVLIRNRFRENSDVICEFADEVKVFEV